MLSLRYPLGQKGGWVGTACATFWVEQVSGWHHLARCLNGLHETKALSPGVSVLPFSSPWPPSPHLSSLDPVPLPVWVDEPLLSIQVFPLNPSLPPTLHSSIPKERQQGLPSSQSDPFLQRDREEGREGNHLASLHTNPCWQHYTLS